MITKFLSTTIGWFHPNSLMESATFLTAESGITLGFFWYGVIEAMGSILIFIVDFLAMDWVSMADMDGEYFLLLLNSFIIYYLEIWMIRIKIWECIIATLQPGLL
jgi:hypothetical protein